MEKWAPICAIGQPSSAGLTKKVTEYQDPALNGVLNGTMQYSR